MKLKLNFYIKEFGWKTIAIMAVILMVLVAGAYMITGLMQDDGVAFEVQNEQQIPEKIKEILPRYQALERALACKVDEEIFVVVTRGEKPTGGYAVDINRIEKMEEEGKVTLVVYAKFTDPQQGDVVTQVVTYPYIVAKTDLKQLPDKIELKVEYED